MILLLIFDFLVFGINEIEQIEIPSNITIIKGLGNKLKKIDQYFKNITPEEFDDILERQGINKINPINGGDNIEE